MNLYICLFSKLLVLLIFGDFGTARFVVSPDLGSEQDIHLLDYQEYWSNDDNGYGVFKQLRNDSVNSFERAPDKKRETEKSGKAYGKCRSHEECRTFEYCSCHHYCISRYGSSCNNKRRKKEEPPYFSNFIEDEDKKLQRRQRSCRYVSETRSGRCNSDFDCGCGRHCSCHKFCVYTCQN